MALTTPAAGQIVRGLVVDSITKGPVSGGVVVLVDAVGTEISRTITDERGQFLLRASAAGRYRLRVEDTVYPQTSFPLFDLALEQMLTFQLLLSIHVQAPVDPEPDPVTEILSRVCPAGVPEGEPVILGVVSGTDGAGVEGAEVRLVWAPLPDILAQHSDVPNVEGSATTGTNGFFGVCGVPPGNRISMYAAYEGATSEVLALKFEGGGVYRSSEFSPMANRIWRQDLQLLPSNQRNAVIRGTVVDTSGGPVAEATVRVSGLGITSRTSFLGAFSLAGLPPGDLQLEVAHIGYRPTRGAVEVAPGETVQLAPDFLQIARIPTELEPITVEADAPPPPRRDLSEFNRRRETTNGSFITRAEFERAGAINRTTDVLRRMQGLRIRPGPGLNQEWVITTMRGESRSGEACYPLVFRDRQFMGTTGNVNVDRELTVTNIEAVEVYQGVAGLPPEFNRPGSTCGVIAFWTR
jgi:hypothetical protein